MIYSLVKLRNSFIDKIRRKILKSLLNIRTIGDTYRVINRIDAALEVQCLEENILVGCQLHIETEFFDEFLVKFRGIGLVEVGFPAMGKRSW